eukprot:TRINITY_DN20977_c0_g1_i1.p1 TRINITY_DN20977_c0_g1~~TRINITY_DN20977_c0_g1_i1.p1  ORF type:complete len:1000 (+),score=124.94 TRINITY_DN20977_c0_g1_i1:180-3179(+)
MTYSHPAVPWCVLGVIIVLPHVHADLAGELDSALFYNADTVRASDVFEDVGMAVSYNEPDNVTCSNCQWSVRSPWTYPWQRVSPAPPSPPSKCAAVNVTADTDLPGCDIESHALASFEDCVAACCASGPCQSMLFEERSDVGGSGCTIGQPCCWLKSCAPCPQPKPGTGARSAHMSGKPSSQPSVDEVKVPPLGYRSSPALGGVSAGSVELRSDGSFRDWTIFNQGPAGSGKYGLVDDAYLGLKIGDQARILRTQPPRSTGGQGVEALEFSGSYPVTRLQVQDSAIDAYNSTVFAYSTLKPTSLKESAYPAIAFTLSVHNPTATAVNASLMLALPLGAWTDCARPGGVAQPGIDSYAACMHSCNAGANCSAWEFSGGACSHSTDVPLTAHKAGSYCGVASESGWEQANGQLFRSQRPEAQGPSMGDMTLQPVLSQGAQASYFAADDPSALWGNFSNGFPQWQATLAQSGHGAVAVTVAVPAGGRAELSIVFAWHFPDRDFSGETIGNMYTELWPNSSAVARELGSPERLASVLSDINTHHSIVAHRSNPAEVWLKDMLLNQWSHLHMLMWYKDGRLREYEAWSCDDVDSVHNDYQRHLMYLWAFPEFELNKLEAWSSFAQASDGHVYESLGYTGKHLDSPGGRVMGDTTSLFVLEMYEIVMHSGNTSYLQARWGSVKRAAAWMVQNAATLGLPRLVETTYDHFGFGKRQAVAYNAHVYLTAMSAFQRMSVMMKDSNSTQMAESALTIARAALVKPKESGGLLWNQTSKFFTAHSETSTQIFTDTLYGQMLSHSVLGEYTLPTSFLEAHLEYEWTNNQDLYGMRVLNHPVQEDSIWMNGPPTWAYLQLALGNLSDQAAFEPFKRMSENFRTRLKDMWNLRALTHTQTEGTELEHGQPREQGHYGFMLTDLFLIPLLSGQSVDMTQGKLQLDPRWKATPYVVPVMIMGCHAALTSQSQNHFELKVGFGSLKLPAGGLSVGACVYSGAVALDAGQSVQWNCS